MNTNMPFLYPNTFEGTINWGMNDNKVLERLNNLEKEVISLKNRINRLENKSMDNYSNNYQPNSYNMM